jgi:hypothetical protein
MSSILPIWATLLENQVVKEQKRGNIAAKIAKIAKTLRN